MSDDAQRWSELTYGNQESATRTDDRCLDKKAKKDTLKALKNRIYESQRSVYDSLMRTNVIWAEKILRDDVAAVRLLASMPFVDKNNIGAFGFSMGAHRCWLLSAFCEELRVRC